MFFLVAGEARGEVLKLDEPLSFWGGVDPETGEITDLRHPQSGMSVKGKVIMMPFGRGSSSGSSVVAEGIRSGSGPSGIIMMEADEIIAASGSGIMPGMVNGHTHLFQTFLTRLFSACVFSNSRKPYHTNTYILKSFVIL